MEYVCLKMLHLMYHRALKCFLEVNRIKSTVEESVGMKPLERILNRCIPYYYRSESRPLSDMFMARSQW